MMVYDNLIQKRKQQFQLYSIQLRITLRIKDNENDDKYDDDDDDEHIK